MRNLGWPGRTVKLPLCALSTPADSHMFGRPHRMCNEVPCRNKLPPFSPWPPPSLLLRCAGTERRSVSRLPHPPALPVQACNVPLQEHDPELYDLIEAERTRQASGLELIASEVRHQLCPASGFNPRCH